MNLYFVLYLDRYLNIELRQILIKDKVTVR